MNISDIPQILSGLKAIGITQSQIAVEIGCSQPTISDMSSGKAGVTRPSHAIVSGLERLAAKHGIAHGDVLAAPKEPA